MFVSHRMIGTAPPGVNFTLGRASGSSVIAASARPRAHAPRTSPPATGTRGIRGIIGRACSRRTAAATALWSGGHPRNGRAPRFRMPGTSFSGCPSRETVRDKAPPGPETTRSCRPGPASTTNLRLIEPTPWIGLCPILPPERIIRSRRHPLRHSRIHSAPASSWVREVSPWGRKNTSDFLLRHGPPPKSWTAQRHAVFQRKTPVCFCITKYGKKKGVKSKKQ